MCLSLSDTWLSLTGFTEEETVNNAVVCDLLGQNANSIKNEGNLSSRD